jgi:hypothetical protein
MGEFRWLPLREAFADLVSVVGVVEEPLFADFLVLWRRSFLVIVVVTTDCGVVSLTIVRR